jgi:hypothetical protein
MHDKDLTSDEKRQIGLELKARSDRYLAESGTGFFNYKYILLVLVIVLPISVWLIKDNQVQNLKSGNADFCAQEISQSKEIAELNQQLDEFRAMLVKPVQSSLGIDRFADSLKPKNYWTARLKRTGCTRLHRLASAKRDGKFAFNIIDLSVALNEGADLNVNRWRVINGQWIEGDASGQTPLMQIIIMQRWNMLQYILEHHIDKVDKSACNWNGMTAADYVLKYGGDDKQQFYTLLSE